MSSAVKMTVHHLSLWYVDGILGGEDIVFL